MGIFDANLDVPTENQEDLFDSYTPEEPVVSKSKKELNAKKREEKKLAKELKKSKRLVKNQMPEIPQMQEDTSWLEPRTDAEVSNNINIFDSTEDVSNNTNSVIQPVNSFKKKSKKQTLNGVNQVRLTPKFRKEEIHSSTVPFLECSELLLNNCNTYMYIDELQKLNLHSKEAMKDSFEDITKSINTLESTITPSTQEFNADEFLSTITDDFEDSDSSMENLFSEEDLFENLPDLHEIEVDDLNNVQLMNIDRLNDEVIEEDLIPLIDDESNSEMFEEQFEPVPEIKIDTSKLNLIEESIKIGTVSNLKDDRPITSITYNKEHLEEIAGRVK